MAKKAAPSASHEAPLYCLNAFSHKANSSDFYIQNLQDHLNEHKFTSIPHKHDFYLMLFVTEGGGTHTVDFKTYPVKPATIFLMTPGQVHSWNLVQGTDGFIIFFTRSFYQMQMRETNLTDFPFYHSLNASPIIALSDHKVVRFVFDQMLAEYANVGDTGMRMLRTYLDLLSLQLAKHTDVSLSVEASANTYKLRKLEQLIEENFRTLKQPSDYAELMNLSPSYLNAICKDNLGKTLSDLIQERLILEAKRLFAYSDMNVNQVAATLHYADPSYFVRFFKKNTGATPEDFRRSIFTSLK